MRRSTPIVCLLLMALAGPSASTAGVSATYQHTYQQVDRRGVGPYDGVAGRNLVDDGVATQHGTRPATDSELRASIEVMRRMLAPAPTPAVSSVTQASAAPVSTSSGWDSTAGCESGGDWSANTGNGYYGGLQFDSATWDAYGDPAYPQASDAPPSAQIAAADQVPYDAWPNC